MDKLYNFNQYQKLNKSYGGANGNKICIVIDNKRYMLKFPSAAKQNKNMSYSNSVISEYLGSHIFNLCGIKAQETILGTYQINNDIKVAVACKDFTKPGLILQDFASLKNQIIDTSRSGKGTELNEILDTINEQDVIQNDKLMNHFWEIFVIDALIGNWDRHNGNWGFLYDEIHDTVSPAPIFDCGSALYPQADEETIREVFLDENKALERVYNFPTSAIAENKHRINYYDFLMNTNNIDCLLALKNIYQRIDMTKIAQIIKETPIITKEQKTFYMYMLGLRKELIIDKAYERAVKLIPNKASTFQTNYTKPDAFESNISDTIDNIDISDNR